VTSLRRLTLHTDTLLNTTVTCHGPDLAIYDWEAILVVLCAKLFSSNGQSDSIGDTLTQGTGGDLDTGKLDLWVSSSHRMVDRSVIVSDLV
jgi:hypothetical protein